MNHQFQVAGMTCGHCVKAVQRAVQTLDAQAQVTVDLPTGRVDVDSIQPREALAVAIKDEGYAVQ
ncbi:MAG: copper chaperone [Variovorax sp.]|nr:MAG: copper chaperone [Variovorax sp.]